VSDSIDKLIIRVRDHFKVTSVVVTHDMRSAQRVGNHVMLLHDKKIYAHGTPEEFFSSQDPIIRQFVDGVADPQETYF
jgi:phospholipid/cholesterol/gamma-HCH transport system ATP-binding protein